MPPHSDVWVAFAEHFLDTETRHEIPDAAFTALEHDLTPEAAFDIWLYEVTPVLYGNLWTVAGAWAGWDREWLERRMTSAQRHNTNRGWVARTLYRLRIGASHATWLAIEHCMRILLAVPPAARARVAAQLVWLGRHFFDFAPQPMPPQFDVEDTARLYAKHFLPGFLPLVVEGAVQKESQALCTARVQAALDQARAQKTP